MKIRGVLLFIILLACDTCNGKCDEYITVIRQTGSPEIHPLKTDVLNELISFYNATGIYNDLDSFKDCVIEMECQNYTSFFPKGIVPTNHGEHSEEPKNSTMDKECKTGDDKNVCNQKKPDLINNEDHTVYDLNIIYVNKNDILNDADLNNNHTKNTMFMVVCDYAENACDDVDGNAINLKKLSISNDVVNKTMTELEITLKRDEDSVIQPMFTGFATRNVTTGSTKNTPLDVKFICKYKESSQCKRKANNSEEIVTVPSTSFNVYLISDYVQNGTKTKYKDCKKVSGDTNNTFNLQCEGTNFTSNNRDVLFSFPISSKHNGTFNLHCQVSESNLSTEAKQPKDVLKNEYNLLNFNNCYSNQNVNDRAEIGQQNFTLFLNTQRGINNITTNDGVEFNKTAVTVTNTEDKSNVNNEKLFKIHINTHKMNNCSQNQLFSITEGKIIDKQKHFIKEDFPEHYDVELKLLNCLNETYPFNNNTAKAQQTKLIIIFENDTDIKTDNDFEEPTGSNSIIFVCNPSYHDKHKTKIDSKDNKVFVCESKAMSNNITMGINSSDILPNKTKDNMIHSNIGNTSDINEANKANCSLKATDKTLCAPKCDTENVDGCNNVSLTNMGNKNNESIDNNDLSNNKYELKVDSQDHSQSNGSENLSIESGDSIERISLILLVSVAGTALLIALVLRKCAKRGVYRPAPQRDPQDYEDTAF